MDKYSEVGVPDFLRLMKDYLDGKIGPDGYQMSIFALMKQRTSFTDEEYLILQKAYGDADDYDPIVRLEFTFLEPELRRRVANSIKELAALGSEAVQIDSKGEVS